MQYGYKISGFGSSEKFFEAERYLDKKLKDFTKEPAVFEEDGSRKQRWVRESEGAQTAVELVKNITESAVLVFSDIPLKMFRFGGLLMYLRDLPAMIFFAALYWVVYPLIAVRMPFRTGDGALSYWTALIVMLLVSSLALLIIILVSDKFLSARREHIRMRFMQFGGIFSVVLGIHELISSMSMSISSGTISGFHVSYLTFIARFLTKPLSLFLVLILVLRALGKGRKRR